MYVAMYTARYIIGSVTCSLGSSGAWSSLERPPSLTLIDGPPVLKPSSSEERDLTSSGSAPPPDLNLAVMMI